MSGKVYDHWCGHCGQTVVLKHNGKMAEHVCIGAWFADSTEYRKALAARGERNTA